MPQLRLAAQAPCSRQAGCLQTSWQPSRPPRSSFCRAAAGQHLRQQQRRRHCAAQQPATSEALVQQQGVAPPAATPARTVSAVPLATASVAAAAALLLAAEPALALDIHTEPANALSLPTWAVHTSSVLEWVTAMGLMWRYGEVSGNPRWKGMAWGMMPCLGSAMCACTWHFFYNSPDLQFLVALQAFLTVVGNFTCWIAAYRIYQWAQQQQQA